MLGWLQKLIAPPRAIPDAVWQLTLALYPFLVNRSITDQARLRMLTAQFMTQKQFSGAHGLVVTDEMAIAIAAQACLPVLNLGLKF